MNSVDFDLKGGDVLHCTRDTFLSKLIRRVTRSEKTSHTALCIELYGEIFIVDSQYDGTRIRTFEEWTNDYSYKYIVTRPPVRISNANMLKGVSHYINTSYGYVDLVRHLIKSVTGVWLGGKREDDHLVCSEFVMRIYGNPEAYKTTPAEAYLWCLESGFKIIS